jgi:hypothetical protein
MRLLQCTVLHSAQQYDLVAAGSARWLAHPQFVLTTPVLSLQMIKAVHRLVLLLGYKWLHPLEQPSGHVACCGHLVECMQRCVYRSWVAHVAALAHHGTFFWVGGQHAPCPTMSCLMA